MQEAKVSTSISRPDISPESLNLTGLRIYQAPIDGRAAWQITTTFSLYLALVVAMYAVSRVSSWLVLALALPTSGLIVRIFMLQHDCGHNSLFRSSKLNSFVGALCSLVTLTPFAYWRRLHARHHGSWNNLGGRGVPADFFSDCLTLDEYRSLSAMRKRAYRVAHHPALAHFLLPPVIFILLYRLPFDTPASCKREQLSVILLNVSLISLFGALGAEFGLERVVLVHLPSLALAAIIGIWLFSVQHRFEDSQWSEAADWERGKASLQGASHLELPRVLQWFSGNIGLHHVHHLRPGIPNYRLQACHDGCASVTSQVTTLGLREAMKAPSYALWDQDLRRMVPFHDRRLPVWWTAALVADLAGRISGSRRSCSPEAVPPITIATFFRGERSRGSS